MTPEQIARQEIDRQLSECGWVVQDYKAFNPSAGRGIAVREYPTDSGPADYILFIDRKPVGVVEAKPAGTILTPVEEQAERYAKGELKWFVDKAALPFIYITTGDETRFADVRDPLPRPRAVFSFHRPETLAHWREEATTLRARFSDIPALSPEGLRDCQFRAIANLEKSLQANRPRALIQMATGAGKTFTAITSVYRLLAHAKAKRVLFLVDTRSLGEQAEQEFQAYRPLGENRLFKELYNVQRLRGGFIDPNAHVCISTIQRMYSMLSGRELDESLENEPLGKYIADTGLPREVTYNPAIPLETFDLIIVDECHRSIYNLWKQVLDYFDAFYVGLTATPDARTYGFFHQNVVSEYTHEEAVADGVNVGFDVYEIGTEIGANGGNIETGEWVDKRSRVTRAKRWEQLDEDVEYTASDLDRSVVIPAQIRTVVKEFRRVLPSLFPGRYVDRDGKPQYEVPKTLIFAKSDSHADDIVQIIREEFEERADFCKKITYNSENPSQILNSFRNDYYPRVAVTVDMIATGTDVRPLECLLFMRDVKSLNYFEQMKGRGTRVVSDDDLKRVSSAAHHKDHFVIVDAVGVTKSEKSVMRPLEKKKSVSLAALLTQVAFNVRDEDTLTSLANRVARLDREITEAERGRIEKASGGKKPKDLAKALLDAYNPDAWTDRAKRHLGPDVEPNEETINKAKEELVVEACAPFDNPELRTLVENLRRERDQIIHEGVIDKVIVSGPVTDRAKETVKKFKDFLVEHKDDVAALHIFYSEPVKRRKVTFRMAKDLLEAMKAPPYTLSQESLWHAYKALEDGKVKGDDLRRTLGDIIALLRHEIEPTETLAPFREDVETKFAAWLEKEKASGKNYTPEQIAWLAMAKDRIAVQLDIMKEDLERTPFLERGGLIRAQELFGPEYESIFRSLENELAVV